jgi:cation-transporting ATPase 13A2
MERKDAESGLDFIGFIIFENKLKPTTSNVLDELTEAGIRKVMCTGDNILTAISVARECNLIDKTGHCFVPHFAEGMVIAQRYFALLILSRRLSRSQSSPFLGEY